jgi:hypothetical protein
VLVVRTRFGRRRGSAEPGRNAATALVASADMGGVDAEARGHQIPLPFGIGVNYSREQPPFKINDPQLGIS